MCSHFHLFAGGMPGSILFGYALDHSCLLWEKKCDGNTGSCLYYDNHQMAWLVLAVCAVCKVLSIVSGLISWRMYTHKLSKRNVPQTSLEHTCTPTNGQTGNGATGNSYELTCNVAAEIHDKQALEVSNPEPEVQANQSQR